MDETRLDDRRAPAAGGSPPAGGAGAATNLDALVDDFVALHSGMRQRDADWYAAMGTTVGGSEVAAVMGMNPYTTVYDIVLSKIASLLGESRWDGGSEACWWGALFEDVIAAYVATDLGADVKGGEICIQEIAGHRNSPDGFLVARFYRGADGQQHLWTTDRAEEAAPLTRQVLLLEFKCPISRKPTPAVPKHYRPQLWSGLMVAPIAHQGLFVDAVFRKCGLLDLGDTPGYDTAYHSRDQEAWELPVAWGLHIVFAPRLDAPRHVRRGWRGPEWAPGDPSSDDPDSDGAQVAWELHAAYFGLRPQGPDKGVELADFGDASPKVFGRALKMVNRGLFVTRALPPCFADGRGEDLHTPLAIGRAISALCASPPEGFWPVGILPWKLFEVDYVFVERRPGFAAEVAPLIAGVHRMAADAIASGDPSAYLVAKTARPAPPAGKSSIVSEDDIQALFDSLT